VDDQGVSCPDEKDGADSGSGHIKKEPNDAKRHIKILTTTGLKSRNFKKGYY